MKIRFAILLAALAGASLLASCASSPSVSQQDQVETLVAATLQGQLAATDAVGPLDGEIQPQLQFGECANSGQVSVAYVKDGNVWLWVQGAGATQLTADGAADELRLSGDGCQVAYAHSLANPGFDENDMMSGPATIRELRVVSSGGSRDELLAGNDYFATLPAPPEGSNYTLNQFEWQPGAYLLAFSSRPAFLGPGLISTNEIAVVNADSKEIGTLLAAGEGGRFFFSHNGQQLAFSNETSISVIHVDGSNLQRDLIRFPQVITFSEYVYYPPLVWDPADAAMMAAIPPEDGLSPTENGLPPETALWYIPLDGTPAWQAGSIQSIWFPVQEVAFSPDISRIAYLRPVGDSAGNERELVVALSNGNSESLQLNHPQISFESWSPDSQRLMYSYLDDSLRLVITSVDGNIVAPQALPGGFNVGGVDVDWITDNAYIQAVYGDGQAELSLVTVDGPAEVIESFGQPFVAYDFAY